MNQVVCQDLRDFQNFTYSIPNRSETVNDALVSRDFRESNYNYFRNHLGLAIGDTTTVERLRNSDRLIKQVFDLLRRNMQPMRTLSVSHTLDYKRKNALLDRFESIKPDLLVIDREEARYIGKNGTITITKDGKLSCSERDYINRETNDTAIKFPLTLHLHTHSKRMLASLIKESSKRNQIICITHSTHFIEMGEIRKITLVREINGEIKLFTISSPSEKLIERILPRIKTSHQKEFFFANSVLLVEGDTEFGAMPVLSQKMTRDFDQHGVSVIPIGSNYFAYFIELLNIFQIPYLVMCDEDTILTITHTIRIQGEDVRTSSLIKQLNDLDILSDGDKNTIKLIQKDIINQEVDTRREERKAKILSLIDSIKSLNCLTQTVRDLSVEIETEITRNSNTKHKYQNEAYDKLRQLLTQNVALIILRPDFEGIFKKAGYSDLFIEAKKRIWK